MAPVNTVRQVQAPCSQFPVSNHQFQAPSSQFPAELFSCEDTMHPCL